MVTIKNLKCLEPGICREKPGRIVGFPLKQPGIAWNLKFEFD